MKNFQQVKSYLKKYESAAGDPLPRYLFRGQGIDYPALRPAVARIPDEIGDVKELVRRQAFVVCGLARRMGGRMKGAITGMSAEEGLALMQHYGWLTPVIDVTGNVEVAAYFASLGQEPGKDAVIYVFDREQAEEDIRIVGHDFLRHSLMEGAQRSRWLRQDGYGVTICDHHRLEKVLAFDLKTSTCLVDTVRFRFEPGEVPGRMDYGELAGDPMARRVQGLLRSLAKELFEKQLAGWLSERIDAMAGGYTQTRAVRFQEIREELLKYGKPCAVEFLREALVIMQDERVMEDEEVERLRDKLERIEGNWEVTVEEVFAGVEKACGESRVVRGLVERCWGERVGNTERS